MTNTDLETVYEALARELDAAGPQKRELLLAKLVLLLAHDMSDAANVCRRIKEAASNLDA